MVPSLAEIISFFRSCVAKGDFTILYFPFEPFKMKTAFLRVATRLLMEFSDPVSKILLKLLNAPNSILCLFRIGYHHWLSAVNKFSATLHDNKKS